MKVNPARAALIAQGMRESTSARPPPSNALGGQYGGRWGATTATASAVPASAVQHHQQPPPPPPPSQRRFDQPPPPPPPKTFTPYDPLAGDDDDDNDGGGDSVLGGRSRVPLPDQAQAMSASGVSSDRRVNDLQRATANRGRNRDFANETPPALYSIHKGVVKNVQPFGAFVGTCEIVFSL